MTDRRIGKFIRASGAAVAAVLCNASSVRADVRMHRLLSDDMILQRDIAVPVHGWADPGEAVEVTFGSQAPARVAVQDGRALMTIEDAGPSTTQGHPRGKTIHEARPWRSA